MIPTFRRKPTQSAQPGQPAAAPTGPRKTNLFPVADSMPQSSAGSASSEGGLARVPGSENAFPTGVQPGSTPFASTLVPRVPVTNPDWSMSELHDGAQATPASKSWGAPAGLALNQFPAKSGSTTAATQSAFQRYTAPSSLQSTGGRAKTNQAASPAKRGQTNQAAENDSTPPKKPPQVASRPAAFVKMNSAGISTGHASSLIAAAPLPAPSRKPVALQGDPVFDTSSSTLPAAGSWKRPHTVVHNPPSNSFGFDEQAWAQPVKPAHSQQQQQQQQQQDAMVPHATTSSTLAAQIPDIRERTPRSRMKIWTVTANEIEALWQQAQPLLHSGWLFLELYGIAVPPAQLISHPQFPHCKEFTLTDVLAQGGRYTPFKYLCMYWEIEDSLDSLLPNICYRVIGVVRDSNLVQCVNIRIALPNEEERARARHVPLATLLATHSL
ncbi:hypothetical protein CAOG_004019 [Capsaspora owczarzaki ATCC 30864]|uniref:Uncharacterized protein n=2 Tax=Capsaspora owczarzaki (strain ATCC 30864) TaxID=595528 RepID=A0A0D2X2V0_CAPO3|nr:hypothetical protein CAOG_004019 [Capsaspora owczarzaki ATCC 30864]